MSSTEVNMAIAHTAFDHRFDQAHLTLGDSLALFNRLARIEELLHTILQYVRPKETTPKTPRKTSPAVLALCKQVFDITGVPTVGADRDAARALLSAHPALAEASLGEALLAYKGGRLCRQNPAQFLNRNLLAEAGKIAVRSATIGKESVKTWEPPEEER